MAGPAERPLSIMSVLKSLVTAPPTEAHSLHAIALDGITKGFPYAEQPSSCSTHLPLLCLLTELSFARWRLHPERITGFVARLLEGEVPNYQCTHVGRPACDWARSEL